ncbi:MAG: hypothetical protein AB1486_14850 [Planctomycetota bacterium]
MHAGLVDRQERAGDLYAGALEDAQALLGRQMHLAVRLLEAGRREEAELAFKKVERHSQGVLSCLAKGTPKDRARKTLLEDGVDDLRRRLACHSKRSIAPRLRRKHGVFLLMGAALLLLLAALLAIP